jgi:hypothetical protein
MEVHHPHHPTHKKKWTEYIIEFVMLFTAVTLGFFAENIRESIAENHKKEELLAAVVHNFKTDKAEIQAHRLIVKKGIKVADNFIKLLQMDYKQVNKIEFYTTALSYTEEFELVLNEKTRNDAEAKGYFTNEDISEMSSILNKYNYFYNDYKQMSLGCLESCKRFSNDIIMYVLDAKLIQKGDFVSLSNGNTKDPAFNGKLEKPIDQKIVEKIIFDAWERKALLNGQLIVFDSLDLYANKAIVKLSTENK